jgi:hypothetical protein
MGHSAVGLLSAVILFVIGVVASLSDGGTVDGVRSIGNSLVICGAIVFGASVIAAAIRAKDTRT